MQITLLHEFSCFGLAAAVRHAARAGPRRPMSEGTPVPADRNLGGAVHPTHRAIPPSDPAHMRQCLSRFATGVTVIATRGPDGRFVGLTANSFNSLSLDPPLILWSLATSAASLEVFKGRRFFSVSILSVEQVDIARRFATRMPDRFEGVAVHEGLDGIPLLDGAVGWFECERRTQYLHGDHWLFIGEVKRCAAADGSPLVFRHGEFASAGALEDAFVDMDAVADMPGAHEPEGFEPGDQPFYEEYLPFLLARAGHQVAGGFNRQLQRHGLSMLSWRVLAALSSRDEWTIGELCAVSIAKQPTISKLIDRMVRRGMVARHSDPGDARRVKVSLTSQGHADIAPVLQDAAAFNLSLLADYPPEALTGLKRLLRDMIGRHPPA
jgi:flavin reductase (DIM6/NTAB) family NADH-FMN oxidoreductase RutF/DNA-binding MarR family transcriptional regulator